jgi:hypothetical protein
MNGNSSEAILDAGSVEEVVLVSIWRQGLPTGGQPFLGQWVPADEVARVFERQLQKTVKVLESSVKRVTIVDQLFSTRKPVPETLAGNAAFGRKWPIDVPLAEHNDTFASVFSAFNRLSSVRRISLLS